MTASTSNTDAPYKYKMTALPVTKLAYDGARRRSASDVNSSSLLMKIKYKVYLFHKSSHINNINDDDNPDAVVRNKVRTRRMSVRYSVPWRHLISDDDDGNPNSNSWSKMSEVITHASSYIPFPQSTLYWTDYQDRKKITPLDNQNQMITRILQTARSMVSQPTETEAIHNNNYNNTSYQLNLCLKKEIYLDHDEYVTRVCQSELDYRKWNIIRRCISRLQPPLETETVRRELIACLRAGGINDQIHDGGIDRLTNWVMMLFSGRSIRESMWHTTKPAAEDVIKNLQSHILDSDEVCPVCLETMIEGVVVNQLPCSHVYHPGCIMKWLHQCNSCPMCRFPMPI